MKKAIFAILSAALFLTACNTMEGVGKDIKGGGKKLEKTAKEHKE